MKQHGTALAPLTDLDELRSLVGGLGPFLSVHLPLAPATEEPAAEAGLRWRAGRSRAAEAGAPEPMLAVVDGLLEGAQRLGAGLSVIAGGGGEVYVSNTPVPPPFELVRWEPVPALAPLIAVRQGLQPHVVALVDRIGADLAVRRGSGPGLDSGSGSGDGAARTVEGADYPIRKTSPGGWSQRRYQQHAEETRHHNMSDVADELAGLADRSNARVVVIGGDHRAVGMVLDQLPAATRSLVRRVSATRAADGSAAQLDEQVAGAVEEWMDEQLAAALELYDQELGQGDRATAGAADTLAALRESRVATLLVALDAADDRRGWVGMSLDQVATVPEALAAGLPAEVRASVRSAPLVDAAVTAAVATGADVRIVPASAPLRDGLGALLRW